MGSECATGKCSSQYQVYIWGKEDISATNDGDFDKKAAGDGGVGHLDTGTVDHPGTCPDSSPDNSGVCQQDILHGIFYPHPDAMLQTEHIFTTIEDDLVRNDALTHSFFVWYSPNYPHPTGSAPKVFFDLYGPLQVGGKNEVATELGRMTDFDAGVGALVDKLKRRCICNADGSQGSLYDNTVLIFLNDNGAKVAVPNAKRHPTENGERTPIIINDPAVRNAPQVLDDYASGLDLVATVVSYTGGGPTSCGPLEIPGIPTTCVGGTTPFRACSSNTDCPGGTCRPSIEFGYPFLRNLCPAVRSAAPVRKAYLSHDAPVSLRPRRIRTLLTAPGQLGVCSGSRASRTLRKQHVRPCFIDKQCPCDDNGDGIDDPNCFDVCYKPPGGCSCDRNMQCEQDADCLACAQPGQPHVCNRGKRCANDPTIACALDEDCAVGLCQSSTGQCGNDADGEFAEFHLKACVSGADCVPPGVCQPVVLKVQQGVRDALVVRDPNWDPDEVHDLKVPARNTPDVNYLSPGIAGEKGLEPQFKDCLTKFWKLGRDKDPQGTGAWIPAAADPCQFDNQSPFE